jgi:hypothetical protein
MRTAHMEVRILMRNTGECESYGMEMSMRTFRYNMGPQQN